VKFKAIAYGFVCGLNASADISHDPKPQPERIEDVDYLDLSSFADLRLWYH